MSEKEAHARIKIDQLLVESDWRFQDNESGNANILLEQNVKLTETCRDELGNDFEKTKTDLPITRCSTKAVASFVLSKPKPSI